MVEERRKDFFFLFQGNKGEKGKIALKNLLHQKQEELFSFLLPQPLFKLVMVSAYTGMMSRDLFTDIISLFVKQL